MDENSRLTFWNNCIRLLYDYEYVWIKLQYFTFPWEFVSLQSWGCPSTNMETILNNTFQVLEQKFIRVVFLFKEQKFVLEKKYETRYKLKFMYVLVNWVWYLFDPFEVSKETFLLSTVWKLVLNSLWTHLSISWTQSWGFRKILI